VTIVMAVRIFLASGKQRLIGDADGARLDGILFMITRGAETVVTLAAVDVVGAQIEDGGALRYYIAGTATKR